MPPRTVGSEPANPNARNYWLVIRFAAARLKPNLPKRLQHRIKTNVLADDGWRHEHSAYGPIDKVLNFIFNHEDFMVKPQALIQSEFEDFTPRSLDKSVVEPGDMGEETDGEDGGQENIESISAYIQVDSYAGIVQNQGGEKKYPDFIVCLLGEQPYSPDRVLLLIEVKKRDDQLELCKDQVSDYLETLWDRIHEPMKCIAIAGKLASILEIDPKKPWGPNTTRKWSSVPGNLGSATFYQMLQDWAKAWVPPNRK